MTEIKTQVRTSVTSSGKLMYFAECPKCGWWGVRYDDTPLAIKEASSHKCQSEDNDDE